MNNSYVIENGKVFVSNHDGVIAKRDYDDNIKQILVEENILESMQNEIKDIEGNEYNQSKFQKKFISTKIPCFTIFSLSAFGLAMLFPATNPNTTLVMVTEIGAGLGCATIGICGDFVRYKANKYFKKKEERHSVLKELVKEQQSKIESLKREKSIKNINSNVAVINLDHNKESEEIDSMVQEYMDNIASYNIVTEEKGKTRKLTK